MKRRAAFEISGEEVPPGTRRRVEIPVSRLSNHTPVSLSVDVLHGKRPGPVLFVSAAIHGDEVIGVEIMRRLLISPQLRSVAGTLLAVPIVNTYGFLSHSRYLPDRRDLNRVFPGKPEGSIAVQLAHIFMNEVVRRSDIGIDLHSASIRRTNLPQIRLTPGNARLAELGEVFGAPVMLDSKLREGSLRLSAEAEGIDVLLYEGGEGLRFDEFAARTGVRGILRVMQHLGMIRGKPAQGPKSDPIHSRRSIWYRAPRGGLFRAHVAPGALVHRGDVLGTVANAFGDMESDLHCDMTGIVIGRSNMPVVYEGDALFHVAEIDRQSPANDASAEPGSLFDEDEII